MRAAGHLTDRAPTPSWGEGRGAAATVAPLLLPPVCRAAQLQQCLAVHDGEEAGRKIRPRPCGPGGVHGRGRVRVEAPWARGREAVAAVVAQARGGVRLAGGRDEDGEAVGTWRGRGRGRDTPARGGGCSGGGSSGD